MVKQVMQSPHNYTLITELFILFISRMHYRVI